MDKEEPMTELSKLEREINSILVDPKTIELKEGQTLHDWYAQTIGELCRKKIEQAFDAGYKRGWAEEQIEIPELEKLDDKVFPNKDQWIKEHL